MLFTELMHAIYPHLAGERNAAAFMRDMLERLSAVPEQLWFTSRGSALGEDKAERHCASGTHADCRKLWPVGC